MVLGNTVTLGWVKGHDGHPGNVKADEAAAKGTKLDTVDPNAPAPPLSLLHSERGRCSHRNVADPLEGDNRTQTNKRLVP